SVPSWQVPSSWFRSANAPSAFDGASRQAGDEIALQEKEDRQHRHDRDDDARHEQRVLRGILPLELEKPDRHRLRIVRTDQDEGDEELVPRREHVDDRERRKSWQRQRQHDRQEDAKLRRAVYAGRLEELRWDEPEKATQDEDLKGESEGDIRREERKQA